MSGFHASTAGEPLTVLIAGAGIGGMTAALGCRLQGHNVHVFEQSRLASEVGAAIHVGPNANAILRRFGIDLAEHGGTETSGLTDFDENCNLVIDRPRQEHPGDWKNIPYYLMHRGQLHASIRNRALEAGVHLHTSSKIKEAKPLTAELVLESGEIWHGDVIIGADGIGSKTRYSIPGNEGIKIYPDGRSGFRFCIPMEKVMASPNASKLFTKKGNNFKLHLGKGRVLVCYPFVDHTIMNCFAVCPSDLINFDGMRANKNWNHVVPKQVLLDVFADADIHPCGREYFDMAPEDGVRLWEVLDMDTLPSWTYGHLALMGDAAHPFTPWRGQGGGMAIEDGASLAALLPLGTKLADIPTRLCLYESLRRDRATDIQVISRWLGGELRDTKKPLAPLHSIHYPTFEKRMLFFDEYENSEKALMQVTHQVTPPSLLEQARL